MFVRHMLLGLALLLAGGARAEDGRETIRRLVAQLGSGKYAERESANRMLQAHGAAALGELMVATREGKDIEVRLRARTLVRKIRRQLEDANILAGPRLRLVYRDTPVLEALEDFADRSRAPLVIAGDRTKFVRRTITLDTGETTFWLALEQFCQVAGLAEKGFAIPDTSSPGAKERLAGPPRQAVPYRIPLVMRWPLVDGKARPVPSHFVGRVRIRALPPSATPETTPDDADLLLEMDVMSDGGLPGFTVTGLTISKAVDEQGQHLQHKQPAPEESPDDEALTGSGSGTPQWRVPARFRAGKKPSTVLKELHGTVAVRLLAKRSLIRVDEIVSHAGETVRGEEGGALQILQAQRQPNGNIQLRLRWDPSAAPLVSGRGAPVVRLRSGVVALRGVEADADQFAVVDDTGRPWKRVEARRTFQERTSNVEYELLYQPAANQIGPAHLVYSTTRPGIINIPFRLRDVPLR